MPVRYTRKLQPTLINDELLAERTDELSQFIVESARGRMPESNGWSVSCRDTDDTLEHEYTFADFKGLIAFSHGVDLKSVQGEGMVRSPYVMISATCQDKRKVESQVAKAEVVQGFEKVFSVIGAAVLGILGLFVQITVLRVISWEVTIGCFIVGFFLGGLTGFMLGDPIRAFLGCKSNVKTEDDHIDLGVAREEWSHFIDSIVEPIENFSALAESTPSSPMII